MKNYECVNVIDVENQPLDDFLELMKKDGFSCEDIEIFIDKPRSLGLKSFFSEKESAFLYPQNFIYLANKFNAAGLWHIAYFLENPELIPEEWKNYDLVFRTIFESETGTPHIYVFRYNKTHKEWGSCFISIGNMPVPPENAKLVCYVD